MKTVMMTDDYDLPFQGESGAKNEGARKTRPLFALKGRYGTCSNDGRSSLNSPLSPVSPLCEDKDFDPDAFLREVLGHKAPCVSRQHDAHISLWRDWLERAAIMEHSGGLNRPEADRQALWIVAGTDTTKRR